jgi:phage-related protein (TIGR01555 family)
MFERLAAVGTQLVNAGIDRILRTDSQVGHWAQEFSAPAPAPAADTGGLVQIRNDGWYNPTTGLGQYGVDRSAEYRYQAGCIPSSLAVDSLYAFDWLAARIIEKMPSIALVRGFKPTGEGAGDPETLLREFRDLNVTARFPMGCLQRSIYDGRAYGGSVLLIGYKLGNPETELTDEERAGGVAFLDSFGQHQLRVLQRYADPNSGNFGMPELYEVIATGNGSRHPRWSQKFHASRCVRFQGYPLRTPGGNGECGDGPEVGVSVLTPVLADIARYGTSWAAVSNLLQDASIGTMKIAGLVESLASEDKSIIEDRLRTLQRTKSLNRMMFLDADNNEEYSRVAVSFADVPGVMAQIILSISGAADTPAKILFGTSPMGLNANSAGEADLKQFYNTCDEARNRDYGPKLEVVLGAIAGGKEVRVEWPSLWDASENEIAQTRLAMINGTKVLWDMGAVEATDIVEAAKTGVLPETLGTPTDDRAALTGGESPEEAGGGSPAAPPQGAPGAKLAAALATAGRSDAEDDDLEEDNVLEAKSREEAERNLAKAKTRFEKKLAQYEERASKYAGVVKAAEDAQVAFEKAESERSAAGDELDDIHGEIESLEAQLDDDDAEDFDREAAEKKIAEYKAAAKEAKLKLKAAEKAESAAERARDKLDYKVENESPNVQDVEDAAGDYHEAAGELGDEVSAQVAAEIDGHTARIVSGLSEQEYQSRVELDEAMALQGNQARELRVMTGQEASSDREEIEKFHKERAEHEQKMTEIGPRGGRYYMSSTGKRVYLTSKQDAADIVRELAVQDPARLAAILDEVK